MGKAADGSSESKSRSDSTWSLLRWIEALQKSDQMFYNMMMVEIWSIAQTMDELNPGFWADYMQNRQAIMQQQIEERKQRERDARSRTSARKSAAPRRPFSPLNLSLEESDEQEIEMVSVFSQAFEQELSKVKQSASLPPPTAVTLGSLDPTQTSKFQDFLPVFPRKHSSSDDVMSGFPEQPFQGTQNRSTIADNPIPDSQSVYQYHVTELPHLLHAPVIKVQPVAPISHHALTEHDQLIAVTIGCWLTRRFLVPTTLGNGKLFVLKRLDCIDIEPGQSVICQLGFRLLKVRTPIQVQLVKSLQQQSKLTAGWASPSELSSSHNAATEVGIRVVNAGPHPYRLTAGQAFCRLEFQQSIGVLELEP